MEAIEETIETHKHQVFTFAFRFLGNRAEAEDVTQEVLIRLWKNHAKIDPGRVKAWLARVTRNACIDVGRKRTRDRALLAREEQGQTVEWQVLRNAHPESIAQLSELGRWVKRGLDGLKEPYKTVIVLREIQGMTYEEVGQALEMPINSVKVNLHRGRKKLREALREERTNAEE